MPDDDDDDEKKSHICVACGAQSPATNTSYTLIGARHGWRLSVATDSLTGQRRPEWRCPRCWEKYKKKV